MEANERPVSTGRRPFFEGNRLGGCALLVVALGTTPANGDAQEVAKPPQGVETIVVTDRALQGEVALTPGAVTLVDGADLRERNVSSLADLLRYVPGMWAESQYGSDEMRFSSRGSNLDATDYDMNGVELLQDGLPVTTADGNNHNRVLDPLGARYATVARGANALKYGASTLGGAIDFTSPTAHTSGPLEGYVSTGSHGQLVAHGTLSRVFDAGPDALLTLEGKGWDGYRDHSETRREGLYANVGLHPSGGVETRFFLTYVDNDQQLPGALTRTQLDTDPSQADPMALTGNYQLDVDTLRLANKTVVQLGQDRRLELGVSLEEQSLYHPIVDVRVDFDGPGPAPPAQVFSLLVDTDHANAGGMVRYAQRAGRHDLLLGLDYGASRVDGGNYRNEGGARAGLTSTVDQDATSLELYALDRWQLGDRLRLELGAQGVWADRDVVNVDAASGAVAASRGDFSHVNPRVGFIYGVSRGVDLFANASGLYEPPTNFELTDDATGGNRLLDAMHGTVLELGTRGNRDDGAGRLLAWEVAAYYAQVHDEILSIDSPIAPGTSLSTNVDDTTHAGIEAMVGADLPLGANGGAFAPRLSVTLNRFAFDGDRHYGDNDLPSAPSYVVRGELLYRHSSGFFVGPTFDVVGSRFADFANTYRVDGYSLVGLRAGWSRERWRVFADLENAADERYVSTVGVRDFAAPDAAVLNPGAPRSVYLGVQGSF